MDELEGRILKHRSDLLAYLVALTGDPDLADDLFQDTCLEAWRAYRRFRPGSDFAAWFRGIGRNCLLRSKKRAASSRLLAMTEDLMLAIESTWARRQRTTSTVDRKDALADCLDLLPARRRELLRQRYNDHVPLQELAAVEGRSIDAMKMFFRRCRQRLEDCINEKLERAKHEA